jgi:IS30 family transposase
MKKAKDLSQAERLEIGILLEKRYSLRSIAKVLGRSPNTISYEVKENSVRGRYDPKQAQHKARLRKRMRRLEWSKLEEYPSLKRFVIEKLKVHWNPDEIAGYIKTHPRACPGYVSKTAIYDWLRTARGERYCAHLYLQRKRVKKRKPKARRAVIPNRVDISRRNRGADNRTRAGHWEDDTIVGRKGTPGGIKSASERKTRLVLARKVSSMHPDEHADTERMIFEGVKVLSVTRDNGIENRYHERLGIPSFFCRPYASWQKGSVENANKMIRRYFPKGTDFRTVRQKDLDRVVSIINGKPRRILGFRSALECAQKAGIIRGDNSRVS